MYSTHTEKHVLEMIIEICEYIVNVNTSAAGFPVFFGTVVLDCVYIRLLYCCHGYIVST